MATNLGISGALEPWHHDPDFYPPPNLRTQQTVVCLGGPADGLIVTGYSLTGWHEFINEITVHGQHRYLKSYTEAATTYYVREPLLTTAPIEHDDITNDQPATRREPTRA